MHNGGSGRTLSPSIAALLLAGLLLLSSVPFAPAAGAAAPVACASPGPDASQYVCESLPYAAATPGAWTTVALGDDDASGAIYMPFTFTWYGHGYDFAYIGSNGIVCFSPSGCGELLPETSPGTGSPNDLVACLWTDLDPSRPQATVRYGTQGSEPSRVFVVEYNSVPRYGNTGSNTFQVQLTETGEARCMYASTDLPDSVVAVAGTQNKAGNTGITYATKGFTATNAGARFVRCDCTTPGAPTLQAGSGPNGGQISLAWTAPASDGGSPVRSFALYRGTSSGALSFYTTLTGTSYVDCCYGQGQLLFYQLAARNIMGEGPRTAEVRASPPGPPVPPANLQTAPGPGLGQVTLTWTLPTDTGGLPLTSIRVYQDFGGWFSAIAQLGASSTTFVDSGLGVGGSKLYAVSAANGFGEGARGPSVLGMAPRFPGPTKSPGGISGPHAAQVTLTWQAPDDDGGLPITGYRIYRGAAQGQPQALTTVGTGTSFLNSGLQEGARWWYSAAAINAAGEGARGPEVQLRAPSRPSAPLALAGEPGPDIAALTLRWSPPADTGGIALTGYRVYRGETSTTLAVIATLGNVTSFTDAGASLTSASFYRVSARNDVGDGPQGNLACLAPAPWGIVPAVTATEPCPLPAGWNERVVLDRYTLVGGQPTVTPPVDANVVRVVARPDPANPDYYVLDMNVLGTQVPLVRVFDYGLVTAPLSADLLHLPPQSVPTPGVVARVTVTERYDPSRQTCLLELGPDCVVAAPGAADPAGFVNVGGKASLVVTVRLAATDGSFTHQSTLLVPFAGQALATVGTPPL